MFYLLTYLPAQRSGHCPWTLPLAQIFPQPQFVSADYHSQRAACLLFPSTSYQHIIIIIKAICNAQDPLKKATNALSGS